MGWLSKVRILEHGRDRTMSKNVFYSDVYAKKVSYKPIFLVLLLFAHLFFWETLDVSEKVQLAWQKPLLPKNPLSHSRTGRKENSTATAEELTSPPPPPTSLVTVGGAGERGEEI